MNKLGPKIIYTKPRIIIAGHARHGKDAACLYLEEKFGLTAISSSQFCCEKLIFPDLAPIYGYKSPEECFNDRGNHRDFWYQKIWDYNRDDPSRLGREIFKEYDIYCGIRHKDEFAAIRQAGLVDIVIWIDASERLPLEGEGSNSMSSELADLIITNNGTLEEFHEKLLRVFHFVFPDSLEF